MGNSMSFAFGAQAIADAALSIAGTGKPVYVRIKNYTETPAQDTEFEELGFSKAIPPTTKSGTVDLKVDPQPRVKNISMANIAQSMGKLNETSRLFIVSHTFVQKLMTLYPEITEQEQVFNTWPRFMGLVYEGTLYAVKQWAHTEIGGSTVSWRLTCNAVQ